MAAYENQRATIPSAAGYNALWTVLNREEIAVKMESSIKYQSIINQICDLKTSRNSVEKLGAEVIFREYGKPKVNDYMFNMELKNDHLDVRTTTFRSNRAKYYSLKLDKADYLLSGREAKEAVQRYITGVQDQISREIDIEFMRELPHYASKYNKGNRAGKYSHNVNLGSMGSPVTLTKNNILSVLNQMLSVLSNANDDFNPNNVFLLAPNEIKTVLQANSILIDASKSGMDKSSLLVADVTKLNVLGIEMITSNFVPKYIDNGQECFTLVMGIKNQTGYFGSMVENRVVENDRRDFGMYWQGLYLYDYWNIKPSANVTLYCSIEQPV